MRSVLMPQPAMSYGGIRTDRIAVLRGGAGFAQAYHQVFHQLGKVSSTLAIAENQMVEFPALFYPRQPVFDGRGQHSVVISHPPFPFAPAQPVCEQESSREGDPGVSGF